MTSERTAPAPHKSFWTGVLWAIGVVVLDQGSKYLVVERMRLGELGAIGVSPILNFRMAWNNGVNFGLLSGGAAFMPWLLIALAALLGGGLILAARKASSLIKAAATGISALSVHGALAIPVN